MYISPFEFYIFFNKSRAYTFGLLHNKNKIKKRCLPLGI